MVVQLRRQDLGAAHAAEILYVFELPDNESSRLTPLSRPRCSAAWPCILRTGPTL